MSLESTWSGRIVPPRFIASSKSSLELRETRGTSVHRQSTEALARLDGRRFPIHQEPVAHEVTTRRRERAGADGARRARNGSSGPLRGTAVACPNRVMGFRMAQLRERARTSLWLVPAASVVLAVVIAKTLPTIEAIVLGHGAAWYLFPGQADSARELLSTIASSMMTFTGLVFSITILVLQLASSQFSPRVLRTFLEDRSTRVAMGTFIGTFAYAMALLPEVRNEGAEGGERVPALSVFIAFVLVLVSVAVFIRYIHAMAQSIRAVHVVHRVARDAAASIERLYPEEAALEPEAPYDLPTVAPTQIVRNGTHAGVLAAVDEDGLFEIAMRTSSVIALVPRLGDFVVRGAPLFRIWASARVDDEALLEHLALEEERTPHQDPAFAFRQLVDVAERALSPGVNDPTTAVQALDRIHDLLTALANRRFPAESRVDEAGRLRLVLPRPGWDALVRLAFDEIRQYGKGSIQVLRRIRSALLDLRAICPPARRPVLDLELREIEIASSKLEAAPDRELAMRPSAQGQGA